MNTKTILAAVAALAIGSGTYIAVAQDTATDGVAIEKQDKRGEGRGMSRGDKHGHEGRGHGRHHRKHGGRGGRRAMMMDLFEQADTNGDRALTRTEIDTFRAAQVGIADISGDGALSIEEFDTLFRQATRNRMVRAFQRLDRDGDGVIGTAEMDRPIERMIRRMDRDGDGTLTLERGRGKRG